ncbi:MAG: permease-like cell division protein FtsX [Clostridiales bacterium]|nr:permease-like cell division protein FtsX [Candidatus Crickella merdequi]
MFSRLGYSIKQSFSQMGRNKGMYFTSVLAITAMMLILGLFFVAFVNVDLFAKTIQQNYNVVQVYMENDNTDKLTEEIGKQIKAMDGVDNVEMVTSEEALQTLKKRWGDNAYLLDNLQENPLPDSYSVYVTDEAAAAAFAKNVVTIKGVNDITYYQETIDKLAKISRFIEVASLVTMIFLIIISIVIVANTIKLTVMNREKEISIMKYLGATDWFIRGPFILGGVFIGLFSSAVASGLVYLIYEKLVDILGGDIARILSVTLVPANYLIINLLIIFASLGVGIGVVGSIISIRRFLQK